MRSSSSDQADDRSGDPCPLLNNPATSAPRSVSSCHDVEPVLPPVEVIVLTASSAVYETWVLPLPSRLAVEHVVLEGQTFSGDRASRRPLHRRTLLGVVDIDEVRTCLQRRDSRFFTRALWHEGHA